MVERLPRCLCYLRSISAFFALLTSSSSARTQFNCSYHSDLINSESNQLRQKFIQNVIDSNYNRDMWENICEWVESSRSVLNWEIENFSLISPNYTPSSQAKIKEEQLARKIISPVQIMSLGKCLDPPKAGVGFEWYATLSFEEYRAAIISDRITMALYVYYKLSDSAPPIQVNISAGIIGGEGTELNKLTASTQTSCEPTGYGWSTFIKLSTISENTRKYLVKEDVLHIRLAITVFRPGVSQTVVVQGQSSSTNCSAQSLAVDLAQDMRSLLESGQGSDITVSCGDHSFKVHSQILKARSPVFRTMLEAEMSEALTGQIDIEDVDPLAFEAFLGYLYTSSVPEFTKDVQSVSLLIGLMELADKYQVFVLKSHCFEQMIENISVATAGQITVMAHIHSAPQEIRTKAIEFCLTNWKVLSSDTAFQKYVTEVPAAFLQIG